MQAIFGLCSFVRSRMQR